MSGRRKAKAGAAVAACAHRCKDKQHCSHACCKRGLVVATSNASADSDRDLSDADVVSTPSSASSSSQWSQSSQSSSQPLPPVPVFSSSPSKQMPAKPPKLGSPSKSLPVVLPSSTPRNSLVGSGNGTPSGSGSSGNGGPWIPRDASPVTPRSAASQSSQSSGEFDTSESSAELLRQEQRRLADAQRNRERTEEHARIRAQIEADRLRLAKQKADRIAAATGSSASGSSTPVSSQRASPANGALHSSGAHITPALLGPAAASASASSASSSRAIRDSPQRNRTTTPPRHRGDRDAARNSTFGSGSDLPLPLPMEAVTPRATVTISPGDAPRALDWRSAVGWGGLILAVAFAILLAATPVPPQAANSATGFFGSLSTRISAVTGLVATTLSGAAGCAVHAPTQVLTTYHSLTQPSFGSSTFALSHSQPYAVRLVAQGLHVSLAYTSTSGPTALAANAKPSADASAAAAASTPAAPLPPSEAELARSVMSSRSDGLTTLLFVGSAQRDQQRLLDAITTSAFLRGSASSGVLHVRATPWHTQFHTVATAINNGVSSDKAEARITAAYRQTMAFTRVLSAHLCSCPRVVIAIHDAQRLPPHLTPVLERLLDSHTVSLHCSAVDTARGAEALATAALADAGYLTAAAVVAESPASVPGSASSADPDATLRDVDVSSSLLVLVTDLGANALKGYLPPRDIAAPLPTEIDEAVMKAANAQWPRKAFVGRISLIVPFIGPDTSGTAPAAAPAKAPETNGAANW